jgi:hypothetical protein
LVPLSGPGVAAAAIDAKGGDPLKGSGKSMTHFELEEALEENGCAVCRLVSKAGRSYLSSLPYESVNDPDVQKGFGESLGLCNRHAHRMVVAGDGLGISLLYRVAVREGIQVLSETSGPPKPARALSGLLGRSSWVEATIPEPGTCCMVCRAEEESEERYLKSLVDGVNDGSLGVPLDGPGAVCVLHLSRASALAGGLPRALVEATRAALEELEEDLDKHVRHNRYRFSDEP